MTETLCTSAAVKLKAGANATELTAAQYTELINQAESHINTLTRVNFTDSYSGLNDDTKKILEDAASCYAACSAVAYDMDNYGSLTRAQTILNVNWAKFQECMKILKEKFNTDFINNS